MFIRKNNKICTTVFDISNFKIEEKKAVMDQLKTMYNISISSLSQTSKTTHLVIPTILSRELTREDYCGSTIRSMLFYDILGFSREMNSESFKDSKIIRPFIPREKGIHRSKIGYEPNIDSKSKETVYITESKVAELLVKHNEKLVKNANINIKRTAGIFADGSYYTDGQESIIHELTNGESNKDNFIPEVSILNNTKRIVFIDTVYSLSEMHIPLFHAKCLFSTAVNYTYMESYFNYISHYFQPNEKLKGLFSKYGIKSSDEWKMDFESGYNPTDTNSGSSFRYMFNSMFDENETLVDKPQLNTFVPVTYVLLMDDTDPLFNIFDNIVMEDHIIVNPRFFVSKISTNGSVGHPTHLNFNKKDTSSIQKPQSDKELLPNITNDNYKLQTTLISIPTNLSSRLIKSKLKSINNLELTKYSIGDNVLSIPKSILEFDYMSSFHFFSKAKGEEIRKQTESDSHHFYCIRFDDKVDISYYTANIQSWLVNRFASEYYGDRLNFDDFVAHSKILLCETKSITNDLKELKERQDVLDKLFNSEEHIVISKDMFNYEKASFLFLQTLRKIGLSLINIYSRPQWDTNYQTEVVDKLKNENYFFTRKIMENFLNGRVTYLSIGASKKAFLMERLFKIVSEMSDEDVITTVEDAIKQTNNSIETDIAQTMSIYRVKKEFINACINTDLSRATTVYVNKITNIMYSTTSMRLFYLLEKNDMSELLPKLLTSIFINDFTDKLLDTLRTFSLMLYYGIYVRQQLQSPIITINNLKVEVLTNSEIQKALCSAYENWCDRSKEDYKYLKALLAKNVEVTKIENLDEFIQLIISNFTEKYLSSRKL